MFFLFLIKTNIKNGRGGVTSPTPPLPLTPSGPRGLQEHNHLKLTFYVLYSGLSLDEPIKKFGAAGIPKIQFV